MRERGAQAVYRALNILQCFSVERPSVSLTEAAHETGLTLSTTHRILKALQGKDFIVRDGATGRYTVGPAILRLARVTLEGNTHNELLAAAMPHLEHLRTITGETVGIHVPFNQTRLCLSEVVSLRPLRMASGVGQLYPLHAGAAGKVLLAFMPAPVVKRLLATANAGPVGGIKVPLRTRLLKELPEIRKRGYATSFGETVPGASAAAAVIRTGEERPVGAINITGPATRWTKKRMAEHLPTLLAAAREIEGRLGYRADS